MIIDLIYRCPACCSFDWFEDSRCVFCGAAVDVSSRTHLSINGQREGIAYWYDKVYSFELPMTDNTDVILVSRQIRLSVEQAVEPYRGLAGITATHYTKRPIDEGTLSLRKDRLAFSGIKGSKIIPFDHVISVTIESNTVIVVGKDSGVLFFDFLEESGKKWEDSIQKAMASHFAPEEIVEFYPKLLFARDLRVSPRSSKGHIPLKVPAHRWHKKDPRIFFAIVRKIAKMIIKTAFPLRVEGLENIPAKGSAVILSNHCSFLDSIILEVFPRRYIWFMTKSSQYKSGFLRWLLKLARTFPVRRYITDVLAVRNAIRIVQQGHILGIFPEGERSWDGRLLPFKQGTMRLVLALGQPVIPVGISGAYGLMPRWTSKIKRVPVTIRIGPPMHFDHIPIPRQTKDDIEKASAELKAHILDLVGGENRNHAPRPCPVTS
jgi:1-acyl-sn-glycerol-3-phosphate acyltransferase